jgi:hypothetical protein
MATLEQVLRDAQSLPIADQRLLAELIEPPRSFEETAAEQGIGPFDFKRVMEEATFWPEDDNIEEFIQWWRNERNESDERAID